MRIIPQVDKHWSGVFTWRYYVTDSEFISRFKHNLPQNTKELVPWTYWYNSISSRERSTLFQAVTDQCTSYCFFSCSISTDTTSLYENAANWEYSHHNYHLYRRWICILLDSVRSFIHLQSHPSRNRSKKVEIVTVPINFWICFFKVNPYMKTVCVYVAKTSTILNPIIYIIKNRQVWESFIPKFENRNILPRSQILQPRLKGWSSSDILRHRFSRCNARQETGFWNPPSLFRRDQGILRGQ